MEYEKVIIETSKSIYRYFLKIGLTPHTHQANILKCPQNENFIFSYVSMRIQFIFFRFGEHLIS